VQPIPVTAMMSLSRGDKNSKGDEAGSHHSNFPHMNRNGDVGGISDKNRRPRRFCGYGRAEKGARHFVIELKKPSYLL
jgi:hypothetical protein